MSEPSSRPDAEAAAITGADESKAETPTIDTPSTTRGKSYNFPDATGTVDIGVVQVDYSSRRFSDGSEVPVIHVFGRTEDDEPEHIRVHGLEPYFYIPVSEQRKATQDCVVNTKPVPINSIREEKLARVTTKAPRDVGQIRDEFDTHYEADIRFPNRFLIDMGIKSGMRVPERRNEEGRIEVPLEQVEPIEMGANIRMNMFDLEVDDRNGFPEDGEEPIICLTSWDSYLDEYVIWMYDGEPVTEPVPERLPNYESLSDITYQIEVFDDERDMLDSFISYLDYTGVDLISGWNFLDFDLPYILDRIDLLDEQAGEEDRTINSDRLSRIGEIWSRGGWGSPTVKGRISMDLLEAYKRRQFSEMDSYRLDAVGEAELDVGKEYYDGDIGDLWENDPERLLEYSLRDVEICVELDRQQNIIDFWDEVRTFVGCLLEDAPTPSDVVDMYILHKTYGTYGLPSKGQADAEDYDGGAVFDPISGVREWVTVLDLMSLYPMCMSTINASPETKVDPNEYEGETYRAPNGVHFRKEPDGLLREIINELLQERENKKEQRNQYEPKTDEYSLYDQQQAAIKVIMNSLYGVLGWERFRLYDKEMGAAVTATGRAVIQQTERTAEEIGYPVTYGDTDSVMLELKNIENKERALEISFELEEAINAGYDQFAVDELNAETHRFQIEFEKLYRRFFQAGKKKRYAGNIVWKEGKDVDDIDITGFEYKRSDIAAVTKTVQKQTIEMIVRGGDEEEIRTYLGEQIQAFRSGDLPLEDIGIPGGIGQPLDDYDTLTAHPRGAQYANVVLGTNYGKGSKPKRVYLDRVHAGFYKYWGGEDDYSEAEWEVMKDFRADPDVIAFDYEEQIPLDYFEVDMDKMLDKTLKGPIERVIEAIGIPWQDVVSDNRQTGMEQFM